MVRVWFFPKPICRLRVLILCSLPERTLVFPLPENQDLIWFYFACSFSSWQSSPCTQRMKCSQCSRVFLGGVGRGCFCLQQLCFEWFTSHLKIFFSKVLYENPWTIAVVVCRSSQQSLGFISVCKNTWSETKHLDCSLGQSKPYISLWHFPSNQLLLLKPGPWAFAHSKLGIPASDNVGLASNLHRK